MHKKKVAIFAERAGTNAGGTEVYEAELLSSLLGITSQDEKSAASYSHGIEIVPILAYGSGLNLIPEKFHHRCTILKPGGKAGTLITAGMTANRIAPSLFHALFIRPPFLSRNIPVVTTVHDLGFVEYPEHYPSSLVWKLNKNLHRTINYPGVIVTVSEFTRQTLIKKTGIDPSRVTTIHNGMDHSVFYPREDVTDKFLSEYGIRRPYLLYAGRLQPRKNIKNLVRTYEICRSKGYFNGQLVLLGEPRAFLWENEQKYIDSSPYRKDIVQTGHVPFGLVPRFMSAAHAFIFLSLYEGFGFPVIEAMACGTPVVCSNTTSLPEVAGDAAIITDPLQPEVAAKKLAQLNEPDFRQKMISKGMERAAEFTWEKTAREMLDVYAKIINHR